MKISKNTLLLGGAITLGVVCFAGAQYYLRTYLSQAESRLAGSYKTKKVIVAAVELPAGTALSTDNLAVRTIPERYLSSNAVGPEDLDAITGQHLLNSLKPGDPIDRGTLERADRAALSTTIHSGERAITFPVDEISSISGMLVPGDIIDLMFTGPGPAPGSAPSPAVTSDNQNSAPKEQLNVRLILQSVPVIATGKITKKQTIKTENGAQKEVDVDFNTVTLKVNPTDAQQILLGQKLGQLTAILRNADDKKSLGKMVLDESTFKQTGLVNRSRPADYVEIIVGGTGKTGGVKMQSEVGKNPFIDMLGAITQTPAEKPSLNVMDVKTRLGITPPAAPNPANEMPFSKRNNKNG
ncbi:Flp pilus assembly protein CpaB [Undibacterium sp. Dicai25W]|uniref:Flp pilus assembly protein CpaB n=1 Tax=Undibacterium sp. Dicai25W TaxID=3413034 RepID=UPI003BF06541